MIESKPAGVKERALQVDSGSRSSVRRITDYGMTNCSKMDANLMGTSRLQLAFEECHVRFVELFEDGDMCSSLLATRDDSHSQWILRITCDRSIDREFGI
jgi:hypothetical protein